MRCEGKDSQSLAKSTCTLRHRTRSARRRSLVPSCAILPLPLADCAPSDADITFIIRSLQSLQSMMNRCTRLTLSLSLTSHTAVTLLTVSTSALKQQPPQRSHSRAIDFRNVCQSRGLICGGDAQLCGVAVVSKVESLGLGGIDSTCLRLYTSER